MAGKADHIRVLTATFPLVVALLVPAGACAGLAEPVAGEVLRGFAPIGRYGGHWGIDIATPIDSAVRAADGGQVTFVGSVADVLSVTVAHGGGLRTSYSYLNSVGVVVGQQVTRSTVLGRSGVDHGRPALHFSVRIGDVYQDPEDWLGCFVAPHYGLRLIPIPDYDEAVGFNRAEHRSAAYAAVRATRHPRRYLRPPSSRSSLRRRGGVSRFGSRRRDVSSCRCSLAEGRAQRGIC